MRGIAGWFVFGATLVSSAHAFAAGDAVAGKTAFENQCASCHSTEPGKQGFGPSLAAVIGRRSGTMTSGAAGAGGVVRNTAASCDVR